MKELFFFLKSLKSHQKLMWKGGLLLFSEWQEGADLVIT